MDLRERGGSERGMDWKERDESEIQGWVKERGMDIRERNDLKREG